MAIKLAHGYPLVVDISGFVEFLAGKGMDSPSPFEGRPSWQDGLKDLRSGLYQEPV